MAMVSRRNYARYSQVLLRQRKSSTVAKLRSISREVDDGGKGILREMYGREESILREVHDGKEIRPARSLNIYHC